MHANKNRKENAVGPIQCFWCITNEIVVISLISIDAFKAYLQLVATWVE